AYVDRSLRGGHFGFWGVPEEGGVHFRATVLSLSGREAFAGLVARLGTRVSRPHLGQATTRPAPASSITMCCWHSGQPKEISMDRASPFYRRRNGSPELGVPQ